MNTSSFIARRAVGALGLAAVLAAAAVLSGCATVSVAPPSAEESRAVLKGKKAAVLFRLTVEMDSEPASKDEILTSVASIDKNEEPPMVTPMKSPTREAGDGGWIYFLVEPGTHYFQALPNFMSALASMLRAL